jgi:hypothetical protein
MTLRIPWNDGNGNIVLTLTGQGDGTVTVTSDTDNTELFERRQTIHFYVTNGAIRQDICTSNGLLLGTSDGKTLTCLEASQRVAVTVIQPSGMNLLLADGKQLLAHGKMLRVMVGN